MSDGLASAAGQTDVRGASPDEAAAGADVEKAVVMRGPASNGARGASVLNCPRCGLRITLRAHWLAIRYCPRCLARSHTIVELFSSRLPTEVLYADGWRLGLMAKAASSGRVAQTARARPERRGPGTEVTSYPRPCS